MEGFGAVPSADTQATKKRRGAWLRLLTWFTIVGALAAAYLLSVSARLEQIDQHSLRSLAQAASSLEDVLVTARRNIENSISKPGYSAQFMDSQSRLAVLPPNDNDSLQAFVQAALDCGEGAGEAGERAALRASLARTRVGLSIKLEPQRAPVSQGAAPNDACSEGPLRGYVQLSLDLEEILDAAAFGRAFRAVLLADGDGKIIYQHTPAAGALFELPGSDLDKGAATISVGKLDQLRSARKLADGPAAPIQVGDSTLVENVVLAGTEFTLVCHPVALAAVFDVTAESDKSYKLCGAIDTKRARRAALEVSSPLAVALFAFVLIGVLIWPLVKLSTLRTRERMHFVELYVGLLATIAVLMIGAVLLLGTDRALFLGDASTARLSKLADQLSQNMYDEFARAQRQLQIYDKALPDVTRNWTAFCAGAARLPFTTFGGDGRPSQPRAEGFPFNLCRRGGDWTQVRGAADATLFPTWMQTGLLDKAQDGAPTLFAPPSEYRYLSQVFWMELEQGRQVLKATAQNANTPAVSVASRAYYQSIKSDELWPIAALKDSGGGQAQPEPYFVQSFRSLTTGEFSAALSMRSANACTLRGESSRIVRCAPHADLPDGTRLGLALAFRPLALTSPVLAPGVGFIVVHKQSGLAVFHSDARHATVENVFEDEGVGARLQAAARAPHPVDFAGAYRTKPHRLHVRPLADVPWAIVTFESAEITRTDSVETLSRATLYVVLHMLMLALLTGVYLVLNGRETPGWLWPAAHWAPQDRKQLYQGGVAYLLAFGLIASAPIAFGLVEREHLALASVLPQVLLLPLLYFGASVALRADAVATFRKVGLGALSLALLIAFAGLAWHEGLSFWLAVSLFVVGAALGVAHRRRAALHSPIVRALALAVAALVLGLAATTSLGWLTWTAFFLCAGGLMLPLALWEQRLWGYRTCSLLIWLVVALPPATGYFAHAHSRELSVLTELEAQFDARADVQRRAILEHRFRLNVFAQAASGTSALREFVDEAAAEYAIGCRHYADYLVAYGPNRASGCRAPGAHPLRVFANRAVNRILPIYNEMTSYSRYQDVDGGADDLASDTSATTVSSSAARSSGASAERPPERRAVYRIPYGYATLIGGAIVLGLLWAWVTYGARRFFFGELDARTDSLTVQAIEAHNVKRPTIATLATRAQYAFIGHNSKAHDVYDLSDSNALLALEEHTDGGQVLCTHLGDALGNEALRLRVLRVLEQLAQQDGCRAIVVSSVAISHLRSSSPADGASAQAAPGIVFPFENNGESARWRALLKVYDVREVSVRGESTEPIARKATLSMPPDEDWLDGELDAIAGLRSIVGPAAKTELTKPLTRREVIKQIAHQADWFFRALWDTCSDAEKLALTQISREGVINPREANAVRSLLARGLLRMDPILKPVNNSFGRFAASALAVEKVRALEAPKQSRAWSTRNILSGMIFVVLLFLWFTQRDVVETWIAYVGAITVGMSAVLRAMDSIRGGGMRR